MIIKIAVNTTARRAILDIADIFRAKTVDVSDHTVTLQVIILAIFAYTHLIGPYILLIFETIIFISLL